MTSTLESSSSSSSDVLQGHVGREGILVDKETVLVIISINNNTIPKHHLDHHDEVSSTDDLCMHSVLVRLHMPVYYSTGGE